MPSCSLMPYRVPPDSLYNILKLDALLCFRKYETVSTEPKTNVAAVMEGKLKEKLESMGIGCLCLSQGAVIPVWSICKHEPEPLYIHI